MLREAAFRTFDFLRQRKGAYGQIPDGVIKDLARFCRANKPTFHTDPQMAARYEGRREVFLRIMEHRAGTVEELYRLYGGPPLENEA